MRIFELCAPLLPAQRVHHPHSGPYTRTTITGIRPEWHPQLRHLGTIQSVHAVRLVPFSGEALTQELLHSFGEMRLSPDEALVVPSDASSADKLCGYLLTPGKRERLAWTDVYTRFREWEAMQAAVFPIQTVVLVAPTHEPNRRFPLMGVEVWGSLASLSDWLNTMGRVMAGAVAHYVPEEWKSR